MATNKRPLTTSGEGGPVQGPRATTSKKVKFGGDDPVARPGGRLGTNRSGRPETDAGGAEDFDLELDEVGGGKNRRGAVKLDGYDSDSSAGSDGGAKRRKGTRTTAGQDAEDEDDDMFASTAPKGEAVKGDQLKDVADKGLDLRGASKGKEFLDLGDIEGQEFGRGAEAGEESDEDYSDEEEEFVPGDEHANADDAPRARRKSKKGGMGYQMTKFNMAEELEEGRFTADGSYVAAGVDPDATHDNWLVGNDSKKEIKRARLAKQRHEEEQRRKAAAEDTASDSRTRDDCLMALLPLLRPAGESVSGALARLGAAKRRRQKSSDDNGKATAAKRVKKQYGKQAAAGLAQAEGGAEVSETAEAMDVDLSPDPPTLAPVPQRVKDPLDVKIETLTDLASTLTGTHGETDAYDFTHGAIVGMLKSEGAVRRDWVPPSADDQPGDDEAAKPVSGAAQSEGGARRPLISRPSAAPSALVSFQYRFRPSPTLNPEQSSQIYGPFGKAEMDGWLQAGYFGPQGEHIDVRAERGGAVDVLEGGVHPWVENQRRLAMLNDLAAPCRSSFLDAPPPPPSALLVLDDHR